MMARLTASTTFLSITVEITTISVVLPTIVQQIAVDSGDVGRYVRYIPNVT